MKEHSKNSGPTGLEPEICHAVHHQLSHQANWLLWPTTIITSILCFIPTFIIFDFHTHCTYTLLPPLNKRLEQVNMLCLGSENMLFKNKKMPHFKGNAIGVRFSS